MKNRIKKMTLLGIKQFGDPYYQGFAAQIAFFIMLSLVPTVIVVSQLLGVFRISIDMVDRWIEQYLAGMSMGDTIQQLLRGSKVSSIGNSIVLVVLALWASSRAQFGLMRIANYTYSGGRTTGNFWKERFRSLKTMFLTVFTLAFVVLVMVYGPYFLELIIGKLVEGSVIPKLWTYLRWPTATLMYFLMILWNYYVLPIERMSVKELLPGTIFAALGMLLVTFIYTVYVDYIFNFSILYGSLSSMVALMFWFYFLAWVLALGILFNKVWKDTKEA